MSVPNESALITLPNYEPSDWRIADLMVANAFRDPDNSSNTHTFFSRTSLIRWCRMQCFTSNFTLLKSCFAKVARYLLYVAKHSLENFDNTFVSKMSGHNLPH